MKKLSLKFKRKTTHGRLYHEYKEVLNAIAMIQYYESRKAPKFMYRKTSRLGKLFY